MAEQPKGGGVWGKRADAGWVWITRALAVGGFIRLLTSVGFEAPWGAYLLLLGLFFGPEVLRGQLQINRRDASQSENETER